MTTEAPAEAIVCHKVVLRLDENGYAKMFTTIVQIKDMMFLWIHEKMRIPQVHGPDRNLARDLRGETMKPQVELHQLATVLRRKCVSGI